MEYTQLLILLVDVGHAVVYCTLAALPFSVNQPVGVFSIHG